MKFPPVDNVGSIPMTNIIKCLFLSKMCRRGENAFEILVPGYILILLLQFRHKSHFSLYICNKWRYFFPQTTFKSYFFGNKSLSKYNEVYGKITLHYDVKKIFFNLIFTFCNFSFVGLIKMKPGYHKTHKILEFLFKQQVIITSNFI